MEATRTAPAEVIRARQEARRINGEIDMSFKGQPVKIKEQNKKLEKYLENQEQKYKEKEQKLKKKLKEQEHTLVTRAKGTFQTVF